MAKDNVDVIEATWAAFGKGDMEEAVAAARDDAELRIPESLPFGGSYRGPEGFRKYVDGLRQVFTDFKATPEKVLGADDDHVVVLARVSGRTRGGERYEGRSIWLYKMRDGQIVEADAFSDTAGLLQILDAG